MLLMGYLGIFKYFEMEKIYIMSLNLKKKMVLQYCNFLHLYMQKSSSYLTQKFAVGIIVSCKNVNIKLPSVTFVICRNIVV